MEFLQSRFGNVVLAVIASPGAMGAKGTIKLFCVDSGEVIQNQVDIQIDEGQYYEVSNWFLEHSDNYPEYLKSCKKANKEPKLKPNNSIPLDRLHFDEVYLGMGNCLYLRKLIKFEWSASNLSFEENSDFYQIGLTELPSYDEFQFIFAES